MTRETIQATIHHPHPQIRITTTIIIPDIQSQILEFAFPVSVLRFLGSESVVCPGLGEKTRVGETERFRGVSPFRTVHSPEGVFSAQDFPSTLDTEREIGWELE